MSAHEETGSVLDRILAILDAVERADGSLSITRLAAITALPKSTVSRVTTALIEKRYLRRTDDGVALGLRLFELGARASLPLRLRTTASPVIRRLWELTGERVGLWVNRDAEMVSIVAVPGRLPALPTRAGMRSPALTTASGKAFLAFCDDASVVDRVSAPLIDEEAALFRRELTDVRASAIATDSGIAYPGIIALASPVLSPEGAVIGALSIAGPAGGLDLDEIGPLVRSAGAELTERLTAA
jgi:DNA-binding IclR family transcriptional regulator